MIDKKSAPDYIYQTVAALLYALEIASDASHAGMAVSAHAALKAINKQYEFDPLRLAAAKEDAVHCLQHTRRLFNSKE